jgi:hypothetical protein
MKTFSELIKHTHISLEESVDVESIADEISSILERTEQILDRKLTNEEFDIFTDILTEESLESKDKKDNEPLFKKGNYEVTIMTAEGQVKRTASTQKGLLSVVPKKGFNYVIRLDGKDITSKFKTFIKEKQKQALLRKKMIKKLRTESSEYKFSNFFT